MKPKLLLYIVIYTILLNGFFQQYLIKSQYLPFISDIIIFILAFTRISSNYIFKEIRNITGKSIIFLISILLIFSTAIALVNLMSPKSILWGLRMVIRYFLLFILINRYFNICDTIKFRKIIIRFFWLNSSIIAFQYFIEHKYADFIGGTFLNNGEIFVFCLLSTFIFTKEYFEKRIKRNIYLLFIATEMFIAMAAEIKIMYFTIPIAIYGVYALTVKFNFKHIIILTIAFFCIIPTMKIAMSLMYGNEYIDKVFDLENIQKETTHSYNLSSEAADYSFNRGTCIEKATNFILKDPVHIDLGFGIGSGNTSDKFETWINQTYSGITSYNWFTSSWILVEYGWIGFILWILVLLCLSKRFLYFYKKYRNKEIKYWSTLGFLSTLSTFIIAWYNNMPYFNAYLIYLFWAICFVGIQKQIKYQKNV